MALLPHLIWAAPSDNHRHHQRMKICSQKGFPRGTGLVLEEEPQTHPRMGSVWHRSCQRAWFVCRHPPIWTDTEGIGGTCVSQGGCPVVWSRVSDRTLSQWVTCDVQRPHTLQSRLRPSVGMGGGSSSSRGMPETTEIPSKETAYEVPKDLGVIRFV